MKTILAPIDFSPATKGVIAAASSLARSYDGRVVLLNVTQPPLMMTEESLYVIDMDALTARTARAAVIQLEELREKLDNDFIHTEVMQLTGSPVALILEQARKLPADYIVMGSHGHTAFYDLLAGSTATGVVRKATCPVVIVPPPQPAPKPVTPRKSRLLTDDFLAVPRL
jgi:nucleotide-binding universal stress UspA family protein